VKGNARNKPCPCGSGIKAKKCNPYPLVDGEHVAPPESEPLTPEDERRGRLQAQQLIAIAAALGSW